MITFRMTKKDYRKAASQMFFQYFRSYVVVWVLGGVACLTCLIAKLCGESGFEWVIPTLMIWLFLFVALLSIYFTAIFKVRKFEEKVYTLTYSLDEVRLCNETTSAVLELKLSEITIKRKTKSFLFFELNKENVRTLIMPRNNTTKEFEALFSPGEKEQE